MDKITKELKKRKKEYKDKMKRKYAKLEKEASEIGKIFAEELLP